ncbi:LOW QUALITY PROTEIN: meteorin [Molossus nigricans]
MPPPALLCALCCVLLAKVARAGFSEDCCSRGSGLTLEAGSVGQLALACAEGGIEWLPADVLRLTLGGSDSGARPRTCLQPVRPFAGVQVFAERAGGALELLQPHLHPHPPGWCLWALKVGGGDHSGQLWEATRVTAYARSVSQSVHQDTELQVGTTLGPMSMYICGVPAAACSSLVARSGCLVTCPLPPASGWWGEALGRPEEGRAYIDHIPCMPGVCRPCSDTEFLLALCTSDFVIHGTIHKIAHDTELQESVITMAAVRVFRQTLPLFMGGLGGQVQAPIRTPLRRGVCPGPGTFLFLGWSHFGEAWLGCAPRFQGFSRAYTAAHANHLYPCEVVLD